MCIQKKCKNWSREIMHLSADKFWVCFHWMRQKLKTQYQTKTLCFVFCDISNNVNDAQWAKCQIVWQQLWHFVVVHKHITRRPMVWFSLLYCFTLHTNAKPWKWIVNCKLHRKKTSWMWKREQDSASQFFLIFFWWDIAF